ncbi:MAG: hypothetical protein IPM54_06555 [Polyangiaceae bacterium]|nr:hypothetical protein [Polyangiaceae bacterium]
MDPTFSALIRLNQFSTGRRLYTFHRVIAIAKKMDATVVELLVAKAIEADGHTYTLEQRWQLIRRGGKTSAKQLKAQNALQKLDGQIDRALSGLRDGAEAIIKGADDDEKDLVEEVEFFLHEAFPNGVHAITAKSYPEQLVAVVALLQKLDGSLDPLVQKLGLSVNVARIKKLTAQYDELLKSTDTLEFGQVKAARDVGQNYLYRIVAKIMGTYDAPDGDDAQKRAALLAPILAQNEAISNYIRSRRNVPDVDPNTGEEQVEGVVAEGPETPEPNAEGQS